MADVNAPSGQTPTMAPPIRADDQILPHIRWVPIRKTNCYLDLEKSRSCPIYKIAVDLLKNTNFFRAFTASSTIPSIYIQQFWDTILYDKKARCYKCQLDDQWFDLTKETLREALQITPRALLTIINLCLTGKASGFERPRAPVLQILWGIVTRTNINYAERIWEDFTQSIHTFIEDKQNLSRHTSRKKSATLIVIPSIQFTKMIIHHLQRKHRFHPIPDSPLHLSNEEPVLGYLKFSAKGGVQNPPATKPTQPARKPKAPTRPYISIPVALTQPAPTSAPAKSQENKCKQATKTTDKPTKTKRIKHSISSKTRQPRSSPKFVGASEAEEVPAKEPQVADEDAEYQKAVEESMKDAYALPKGPLPPVVIKEPESGKYQPLPKVPGKGKAKVTEEQVAHDLLSLQKHKKTSQVNQYIFQRRVSKPTGSSGHDESPYALLGQLDNQEESKKAGSNPDETSEGQAGSNPDETSKGQAGPDPGDAEAKVQSNSSPMVHAGSDREHMALDVANVSPQPSTEQLDEGFTATVYSNVQENLKLVVEELIDKHSDADKNAETKVESMVNVTIQQALSSISLMTSPIIDLTSRPESPKEHQQLKATTTDTTTTTTTTLPPPNKQKHRGEVSIVMSEVVTDVVDWAMKAPLRNCFRDLPKADMKEILYQRMWESDSYKSHEDHMQLFKALEKSMNRDHFEELTQELAEARKKKKKSRESPKTSRGSPSHQPPPPPPPAGPSKASGAPRASGSAQMPPSPPPPSSTNQESPSKGSAAPNLEMDDDMAPDEQAQSLDDEDIGSAHIPTMNLRKGWWKPFEEERPTTLEPAWSICSSDVPTDDNATFIDWFCKRRGITELKPQDLEGPAYEVVKVFHPDVIHL
nr:hypothetical protein [Tanacetum cinerariifolium]